MRPKEIRRGPYLVLITDYSSDGRSSPFRVDLFRSVGSLVAGGDRAQRLAGRRADSLEEAERWAAHLLADTDTAILK